MSGLRHSGRSAQSVTESSRDVSCNQLRGSHGLDAHLDWFVHQGIGQPAGTSITREPEEVILAA